MTKVLVGKLLRDVRWTLLIIGLLLGAFQCLWAVVTSRILEQLAPFFQGMASEVYGDPKMVEQVVFAGPGKVIRTLIGGEQINLDGAMDVLSIGFVHPLVQTILCIWAVGRASGAIAGEIDRGTMELLMSQPLARTRVILAHFLVDLITIPIICLAMWGGAALGAWIIDPITPDPNALAINQSPKSEKQGQSLHRQPMVGAVVEIEGRPGFIEVLTDWKLIDPGEPKKEVKGKSHLRLPFGPIVIDVQDKPVLSDQLKSLDLLQPTATAKKTDRLAIKPLRYAPALLVVGGLLFAVCGMTMWISSMGRSRWRVLGISVFVVLIMFLVNLIGQMWDVLAPFRPFTIFYYYQPQQVILERGWSVSFSEWGDGEAPLMKVPTLVVLYGVGLMGYFLAWRTFTRRDLPAPL